MLKDISNLSCVNQLRMFSTIKFFILNLYPHCNSKMCGIPLEIPLVYLVENHCSKVSKLHHEIRHRLGKTDGQGRGGLNLWNFFISTRKRIHFLFPKKKAENTGILFGKHGDICQMSDTNCNYDTVI